MSQDHSARLDRHDEDIRELRRDVASIISEIKGVANVLTEMRAQRGPGWITIISACQGIAIMVGLVVSGIVYVASNGQSQWQHSLDQRVSRIEWRADRHDQDDRRRDAWMEKADASIKRMEFAAGWKATARVD